ncbi:MAG: hypothetical protein JXR25_15610 [Pontiellaceae bacterium]|nr:hypothetical protein [Pontiellaceae bacterium]MBN2786247.1 hypothetical protein [Pontiellaceae bacterium]
MHFSEKWIVIGSVLLMPVCFPVSAEERFDPAWIGKVAGQHDMTLPNWGPYTKRYIGISHLPDPASGLRFDLSVFPGFYRGQTRVPNVMFESGYHPWEAAPDLSYFSFRHELEWKDRVYADISYSEIDAKSRLVRAELVNQTELPQSLVLHMMASMSFPSIRPYAPKDPICPGRVTLPERAVWIDALKYDEMHFAQSGPKDDLVYDGKMRGEIRVNDFVDGAGLGSGFGSHEGDTVTYSFRLDRTVTDAHLLFRYRMGKNRKTTLELGGSGNRTILFSGNGELQLKDVPVKTLPAGTYTWTLTAKGGDGIDLDGFAVVSESAVGQVEFKTQRWDYEPEAIKGPKSNSLILKYKDTDLYYGLVWSAEQVQVRRFFCRDLDLLFAEKIHDHVSNRFNGDGAGHFSNIFMRPIDVAPQSKKIIYAAVFVGSKSDVEQRIKSQDLSGQACEKIYHAARGHLSSSATVPSGESYAFSQKRMAATLLTNVVYPVYTQHSYIRHYAPGRWWDCLYTWDSGFIGLGLAELDLQRALECLNAYVTEPGAQSAFIHHGSMVPVQHYLFLELWNRTQSREFLAFYYPRLKQYYEFFVGRLGSSSMDKFDSGLLSSFDYFYNSGGWDDYPAQKHTHDKRLAGRTAPVVNSAQAIRIAKIMLLAAAELDKADDVKVYREDIAELTEALEKYSWDEASGYFGYVQHDTDGKPSGILRDGNGVNYNMGMDGIYPLVAGVGTPEQTERMLAHLESPDQIWSRIGLSAVDQSAPYYRNDGYWNGTVWMPHQWFFWKSLLDLGEGEFAWQVAERALDLWKTEVEASYNCKEHFVIETGRGAGWHQFGALSSPVLKWYRAYCRPGSLTTGFDGWITRQEVSDDNSHMVADLKFYPAGNGRDTIAVVACMNPAFSYTVRWNGKDIASKQIADGVLNISIPAHNASGTLEISR